MPLPVVRVWGRLGRPGHLHREEDKIAFQKMAYKLTLCLIQLLETQSESTDAEQNIILRVWGAVCLMEPKGW